VRDKIAEDMAEYRVEIARKRLGVFDIHED
jgi:hypothetical protein